MKTILVVDDDVSIIKGLQEVLTGEHYCVLTANTGSKGLHMATQENVDLVILDLRLPDKNGEEVCKEIRQAGVNVPILMLTSKKRETDKVVGLEIGADDYVTKPFSIPELLARVKALLRRKGEISRAIEECAFGDVEVDFKKQEGTKKKKPLKLSAKEFEILKFFVEHAGDVITRDMLLDKIWGYDTYPVTRTVDNYILSLRKQIEDDPSHPKHLLTVHTAGYKFVMK
ncbi:MAG: ArsR family transcriptional regulator [Bacteroidetes bacterium]|jgi:DNA-binding response OmpR family regulator|nr:ArsR family transcriptional regulator [Bacteroidota bacterium]